MVAVVQKPENLDGLEIHACSETQCKGNHHAGNR